MAHDDEPKMPFPEIYDRRHLNTLYRAIPLTDNKSRLLRKYFNAMANLYGIITLREALAVIRHFSPRTPLTDEEFLAFAEIARHECEEYWILGLEELYIDAPVSNPLDREIIHLLLFDSEDDRYHATLRNQADKSLYLPESKEALLAYDRLLDIEQTPRQKAFSDFLRARMPSDWSAAERRYVLYDIFDMLRIDVDTNSLVSFMDDLGIHVMNENDVEHFAELYMDCVNNTRLFANRGYTPHELAAMRPADYYEQPQTASIGPQMRAMLASGAMTVEDLRQEFLTVDLPHENVRKAFLAELDAGAAELEALKKKEKVGRNEPCPCGSGKKYKKCCGK